MFIAIKTDTEQNAELIDQIISYTKTSAAENDSEIRYPGENMLRTRERNMKDGVLVDEKIWAEVLGM